MARRLISEAEESAMAAAAEAASVAGAALKEVKATRGPSPTAVLSVRVPAELLRSLRLIAERRRMSLSEVVQEAVTAFAASGGPQVGGTATRLNLFLPAVSAASEAYNPPPVHTVSPPEVPFTS